jgi:hypothetical protein
MPTARAMAMYDDSAGSEATRSAGSSQPVRALAGSSGRGANRYSTRSAMSVAAVWCGAHMVEMMGGLKLRLTLWTQ